VSKDLRAQEGFGLIELLISMVVLNIGILALFAAFNSSSVALQRAGRIATAASLADSQMELYRAITYSNIRLDPSLEAAADSTYQSDSALAGSPTKVLGTCLGAPVECQPTRQVLGPDNKNYRIDTYIVYDLQGTGRQVKKVTVVVRHSSMPSKVYVREASTFDLATGS
jgi:type II secretory pathway pseudopilin PulG